MMDEVHVYKWLKTASIQSTAGNKTRLLFSLFLISTSSSLILAEVFRSDYVAACSTFLLSIFEKNELGG